jgi:hypothetical protein
VIEADEDADVQEVIFVHAEFLQNVAFGDVLEGRRGSGEIEVGNHFVHARIEKGVGGSVDSMDIVLVVALKVN